MKAPAFDLTGKTALVTGASSGLGAHFARTLAAAGANLVLAARRTEPLDKLAEGLRSGSCEVSVLALDVSDASAFQRSALAFAEIDIVVNNAGVVRERLALKQVESDWDAVIDTNLKGMFLVAQAVALQMKARGRGGSIINIASILGLRQAGGVLPYAVSKAGVIQMTKCLALEWARFGIRVNALAPGYIDTDLNRAFWDTEPGMAMIKRIPQRRLGRQEDLDGPLLLMASEAGAYMTGSTLVVDGGHLVSTL
jgi:NAD(P)-dependent dehydrogenase (short-subunit alcohol dehydrogenase family)